MYQPNDYKRISPSFADQVVTVVFTNKLVYFSEINEGKITHELHAYLFTYPSAKKVLKTTSYSTN
jgi:hypothetical protein